MGQNMQPCAPGFFPEREPIPRLSRSTYHGPVKVGMVHSIRRAKVETLIWTTGMMSFVSVARIYLHSLELTWK